MNTSMILNRLSRAESTAPTYEDYPNFTPFASPVSLLRLGIFDGDYFRDDPESCPKNAIMVAQVNLFAKNVSLNRQEWIDNGWITPEDPLGWFQWYCRFHDGRRVEELDIWQINRWSAFRRHLGQVRSMGNGDLTKRARQRQSLLHWAHDPIPDLRSAP